METGGAPCSVLPDPDLRNKSAHRNTFIDSAAFDGVGHCPRHHRSLIAKSADGEWAATGADSISSPHMSARPVMVATNMPARRLLLDIALPIGNMGAQFRQENTGTDFLSMWLRCRMSPVRIMRTPKAKQALSCRLILPPNLMAKAPAWMEAQRLDVRHAPAAARCPGLHRRTL